MTMALRSQIRQQHAGGVLVSVLLNSSLASLAGSRTLVEAVRVRLVVSVLFEPEGWAIFDSWD